MEYPTLIAAITDVARPQYCRISPYPRHSVFCVQGMVNVFSMEIIIFSTHK